MGWQTLARSWFTKPRTLAAQLVAEDALTNEQIAERCGVTRQALDKWKRHPEFSARVAAILEQTRAALLARGITAKQNRLDGYDDLYQRLHTLIEQRAADPELQDVPGGATGLLIHRERVIGSGDNARAIDEYEYDAAVPAEMRALAKQAAQELGEWTERQEHSGSLTLVREYGGFDPKSV
jgi:hypothetical protein